MISAVSASGHSPMPMLSNNLSCAQDGLITFAAESAYLAVMDAAITGTLGLAHAPTVVMIPFPIDTYALCHAVAGGNRFMIATAGNALRVHAIAPGFPVIESRAIYFEPRTIAVTSVLLDDGCVPGEQALMIALGGLNGVQIILWRPSESGHSQQPHAVPQTWPVTGAGVDEPLAQSAPYPALDMLRSYLVSHVCFSQSGRLLVVATKAGHVGIWSVQRLVAEVVAARKQLIADMRKKIKAEAAATIRSAHTKTRLVAAGQAWGPPPGPVRSLPAAASVAIAESSEGVSLAGGAGQAQGRDAGLQGLVRQTESNKGISTRIAAVAHTTITTGVITSVSVSHDDGKIAVGLWNGTCIVYAKWEHETEELGGSVQASHRAALDGLVPAKGSIQPMVGDGYSLDGVGPRGSEAQFWPAVLHVNRDGAVTSLLFQNSTGETPDEQPDAIQLVPPAPLPMRIVAAHGQRHPVDGDSDAAGIGTGVGRDTGGKIDTTQSGPTLVTWLHDGSLHSGQSVLVFAASSTEALLAVRITGFTPPSQATHCAQSSSSASTEDDSMATGGRGGGRGGGLFTPPLAHQASMRRLQLDPREVAAVGADPVACMSMPTEIVGLATFPANRLGGAQEAVDGAVVDAEGRVYILRLDARHPTPPSPGADMGQSPSQRLGIRDGGGWEQMRVTVGMALSPTAALNGKG